MAKYIDKTTELIGEIELSDDALCIIHNLTHDSSGSPDKRYFIPTIKAVRQAYSLGLREAKTLVEVIMSNGLHRFE